MKTTEIIANNVTKFLDMLDASGDAIMRVCQYAAEQSKADPDFIDRVLEMRPNMSHEAMHRMVQVGLGKAHPSLLFEPGPGVKRLLRLPYAMQERFVSDPVPVLVRTNAGWETLRIDVRNLTPAQASQVFKPDGIRSEAEQRAVIEDAAAKTAAPKKQNAPYRVVGKELVVMVPCRISFREMAQLLAQGQ